MIMQWDAASAEEAANLATLDEDGFAEWMERYEDRRSFDVDKAWHAVHFTLTGREDEVPGPLGDVTFGGRPFGHEFGYDRPRYLAPDQVAACAAALGALGPDDVRARIDLGELHRRGIYPAIWDRDPEAEQLFEFVVDGFEVLRAEFAAAAADGSGLVVSLL